MREKWLIDYSLRKYIIASVMSMAVSTVNNVMDAFLMGNLLGADALSAVNVTLPVNYALVTIQCLLAAGAAIVVSKRIGERRSEEADAAFTVSLISLAVVGLLLLFASVFLTERIAGFCCREERLLGFAEDYCRVEIACSAVIMFQIALSSFAHKTGNPDVVLKANIASMTVNVLMDIIYVRLLNMGTAGAALATVTGAAASILILLKAFIRVRPLHLRLIKGRGLKLLAGNIAVGITPAIQTLAISILTFVLNYFIQKDEGADGVYVLSIGMTFLTFSMFFAMGVQGVLVSMGSMLSGQRDHTGLRILFFRCLWYSMPATLLLTAVQLMFPRQLGRLFKAGEAAVPDMMSTGLRAVAIYAIPIAIILLTASLYQVEGHVALSVLLSASMLVLLPLSLAVMDTLAKPEYVWYGIPVSGILSVILCLVASVLVRDKNKESFFFLLPQYDLDNKVYESTLVVSDEDYRSFMERTVPFFEELSIRREESLRYRLCVEEMLGITVSRGGEKKYIDVRIAASADKVSVIIKDNCPEYNPLCDAENDLSVKIIRAFCDKVDYVYSFGQNMVFMEW